MSKESAMWLGSKRKNFSNKYINCPLGKLKLPPKLDKEILEQIVIRLRNGTATEEDKSKIYEGHIRLAISLASRYLSQARSKAHDLVSEAMVGLAYAIEKAPEKLRDNNITPWIILNIHRFLHQFISKDHIISVPLSTIQENAQKGINIEIPKVFSFDLKTKSKIWYAKYFENDDLSIRRKHLPRIEVDKPSYVEENTRTILEILDLAIELEQDENVKEMKRLIIQLRKCSYNDREIAEMLNISNSYVAELRKEVEYNFNSIKNEL